MADEQTTVEKGQAKPAPSADDTAKKAVPAKKAAQAKRTAESVNRERAKRNAERVRKGRPPKKK